MSRKSEGIRVGVTAIIWGFATGMLAICIPLVAITGSPDLPLAIIVGTTISTIVIWYRAEHQPRNNPILTDSSNEIAQRVANLEMIVSHQELDLDKKINQLESKDK